MRLLLERRGEWISLLPSLKKGGEGSIHPIIGEPGMVAKVFTHPSPERAERVCNEIRQTGGQATAIKFNVAIPAEIDAGIERLRSRGLLDGDDLTDAGRALREGIEVATDAGDRAVLEALGDDVDELVGLLRPWAKAVVAAGGYPMDPSNLGDAVQG